MLGEEFVEVVKVAGFLVIHVLHERAQVWMCAYDRRVLCSVDEGSGEFSCLVDAESAVEKVLLGLSEGLSRGFGLLAML